MFPERTKLEPRKIAELGQYVCVDSQDREGDDDTRDQVYRNRYLPFAILKWVTFAQPEDERTQDEPCISGGKLPRQDPPERDRAFGDLVLQGKLTREKEAEERPHAEDYQPPRDWTSARN